MRQLARPLVTENLATLGPWLNGDQACEYLALPSRKALYQAVRRGQIPAHRLGRRLRFSKLELDRWLDDHRTLAVVDLAAYDRRRDARLPKKGG